MARRVRVLRIVAATAVVALTAAGSLIALYARGGGALPPSLSFLGRAEDPLAASSPEEAALRTIRLAGYERAVVGESGGTAVLRLELPAVTSAADAELAWQSGFAALSGAYPRARSYVVQLFSPGAEPLLEVEVPGDAVRAAVRDDDAAALRKAAGFRHLVEEASDG